MTIKVREIEQKNNLIGVQLDIHKNGYRRKKMLEIKYIKNPKTPTEREINKERKEIVKKIVASIELNDIYSDNLFEKGYQTEKDFFEYCEEFIERKKKFKDIRLYKSTLQKVKEFWKKKKLPCSEIDEKFLIAFRDYLDSGLNASSPYGYFKKLKRIIAEATISKHFKKNPAQNIKNIKGASAEKETLLEEEIALLSKTECKNNEVKKAFLFSCFTGLRFCDIETLRWSNIVNEKTLSFIQAKTKQKLTTHLHETALKIIGEKEDEKSLIFKLPSHTTCNKVLKKWVEKAEINKHITWHCARHSFATSLIFKEVGIYMVSELLGHKDLRQTKIYVRTAEQSKIDAINKLSNIL